MTPPTLVGPVVVQQRNITTLCAGISTTYTAQRFAFYCDIGHPRNTTDTGARFLVNLPG